jgi:hypothetical protein
LAPRLWRPAAQLGPPAQFGLAVAFGPRLAALPANLRQVFPYRGISFFRHKPTSHDCILAAKFALVKQKVKVLELFL